MVIIACLISNGYDALVCNSLDPFEKTPYMLPESSAESIEVAQKNITERLGSKQILFDFDEILYETNEDGLCHQVLYTIFFTPNLNFPVTAKQASSDVFGGYLSTII